MVGFILHAVLVEDVDLLFFYAGRDEGKGAVEDDAGGGGPLGGGADLSLSLASFVNFLCDFVEGVEKKRGDDEVLPEHDVFWGREKCLGFFEDLDGADDAVKVVFLVKKNEQHTNGEGGE